MFEEVVLHSVTKDIMMGEEEEIKAVAVEMSDIVKVSHQIREHRD